MRRRGRGVQDIVLMAPWGHPLQSKFNFEANCVTNHFLRYLGTYAEHDCIKKVIVEAGKLAGSVEQVDLDILSVSVPFALDANWLLDVVGRKKRYLSAVVDGMSRVASKRQWNLPQILHAKESVELDNYVNRYPVLKGCRSRSGNVATAWVLYEVDRIEIAIIVIDNNGSEMAKSIVAKMRPHEIYMLDLLGKLKWVSASRVVLLDRSGEIVGHGVDI